MVRNAVAGLAVGQSAVIHFEYPPILSVAMAVYAFACVMVLRNVQFMARATFLYAFMFERNHFP